MKPTTVATALFTITIPLAAAACGHSTTQEAANAVAAPSTTTTVGSATTTVSPTTVDPAPTTVEPAPSTVSPAPTTVERPTEVVDDLVRIDHGRMHLRCVGAGPTTVLLIAGWGDPGDKWGAIEPAVAERTRVCSYARFGTGTSDAPSTTQTFATQAADLHALLDTAGESGPYVLLGHSFGGAEAVTFASTYEDEVTGLILLDATPTTWPATVCSVPAYEAGCTVMRDPSLDSERLDVFPAFEQVATITSLGDLPMTIMTAAHRDPSGLTADEVTRLDAEWAAGMQDWAGMSPASTVVVVEDTGHHIELDQPQLVIEELLELLHEKT
jgi:pimeloyl-ACP methyl ester carboxylesterase